MRTFTTIADLAASAGQTLGTSQWRTIHQRDIDLFADAIDDHQWIHVDPRRAATGPFGTTIAHGSLTLSLVPRFWQDIFEVQNVTHAINYGWNRVRFPAPVPVGARIRGHVVINTVDQLAPNTAQVNLTTTVELEKSKKPACVAERVVRYIW
jgi:acyl dehydratase